MAKVLGLREQRVQFFYDTDFRTVGVSAGADLLRRYCLLALHQAICHVQICLLRDS